MRRCFAIAPGDAVVVRAARQRYGQGSYLVASPVNLPEPAGQAPLHALLEALLDNCRSTDSSKGSPWFADIGANDGAVDALASSLGCGVLALQPPGAGDARSLDITRCINDPVQPFAVLPTMAAAQDGAVVTLSSQGPAAAPNGTSGMGAAAGAKLYGVALDDLFALSQRTDAGGIVAGVALPKELSSKESEISLLKVTPQRCCGKGASLAALQGAKSLLKSGRVRCALVEMDFDPNATEPLLEVLHGLEHDGYRLLHSGPIDSPHIEVSEKGSYPVFDTDTQQLRELSETLLRIRRFDERSGYRVYSNGLSLDRDGHYFDYTDLVVACQGRLPKGLVVQGKAEFHFKDGMWWPLRKSSHTETLNSKVPMGA